MCYFLYITGRALNSKMLPKSTLWDRGRLFLFFFCHAPVTLRHTKSFPFFKKEISFIILEVSSEIVNHSLLLML